MLTRQPPRQAYAGQVTSAAFADKSQGAVEELLSANKLTLFYAIVVRVAPAYSCRSDKSYP